MTAEQWQPILEALYGAIGLAFTTLAGIYVPRAIAAFEARTGIALTEQEQANVRGAVETAKGLLLSAVAQGKLKPEDLHTDSPAVQREAADAVARVPDSAPRQGVTAERMTKLVVASIHNDPAAADSRPAPPLS